MSPKRRQNERETADKSKKEKRGELALMNADLEDAMVRNGARDAWRRRASYSHGSVELSCEPFSHGVLLSFLNQSFAESLQTELLQLHFHRKSNDLYQFQQSDDLKKRNEHHITELRSVLFGRFRSWLSEMLEVDLEPTVDISCAKYQHTDVLLCHDDECEGRRVAFILYLVPPWDQSDGGTLDLYNTDEHGQPWVIVKSLLPCWNSLVFFEVSPVSFHQVAEVLCEGKCRLSVSGWFHGPSLPRPPQYLEPPAPRHTHIPRDESVLYEWVSAVYLDPFQQSRIQQEFEDNSEIRLPNFLQEEKFKQVSAALRLAEIQWVRRGPPNKRGYARAELESVPVCVRECWELLSSESFFLLLGNLTGLALHYLATSDGEEKEEEEEEEEEAGTSSSAQKEATGPPVCVGELRRWCHGDYTLLHDAERSREFALDLLLHLGITDWKAEFGGFTSYIAHGEDEELLTVVPEGNSLALVYRDKDTLKFIKHVNQSSSTHSDPTFYDFSFIYYE